MWFCPICGFSGVPSKRCGCCGYLRTDSEHRTAQQVIAEHHAELELLRKVAEAAERGCSSCEGTAGECEAVMCPHRPTRDALTAYKEAMGDE